MSFIIYKMYLNEYLKLSKLKFIRLLPAGKGTLPHGNLHILNLQAGSYWSRQDLSPEEAGL